MGYVVERPASKKQGQRWRAAYRGADGRERTRLFGSEKEAHQWLQEQEVDLRRGDWVDPRRGQLKLREYADGWLDGHTRLRATTRVRYRELLDRHILPQLGSKPLGGLEPSKIRDWHSRLHNTHPATAAGAYRLLSAICKTAVADGVIPHNPCRVIGASVERPKRRPVASIPDVARAVATAPERFQAALLLAAWCQLRRGEILGLQRGDVNPLKGTITIVRTWTTSGEGPPKTEAGWRSVAMPEPLINAIRQHLDRHVGPNANSWLFPGAGNKPVAPRTLDRVWTEAREAVGLGDLRLHDLRHSGLTWTAQAGASVAELMHRAGHSSPAAAMRYQHATEARDHALAKALSKLAHADSQTRADKAGGINAE